MIGTAGEPLEGFYFSTGRTNIFRGFTVKIKSSRPGVKTKYPHGRSARVKGDRSAPSSVNHAQDPRHEFKTEKIHPSALPVTKGHALEAVTLDLHRHAQNRQWTVFDFFEFQGLVLHTPTYARIREGAHVISIYRPLRFGREGPVVSTNRIRGVAFQRNERRGHLSLRV
jgi:hypothetical protein